jgi:DNA-binding response OmpR family regulator
MVVEDDPLLRGSVKRILEKAGHQVWVAAAPHAAMNMLENTPVDVVVTDIHMPGMSGVDLILKIDHHKVIAMSGGGASRAAGEALADAKDAGARHTISKPFQASELIAAIEAVLKEPG